MRIFTTGEIAQILNISRHKLYYMEETGKIPRATKTGTWKRFYTEEDLAKLRKILLRRKGSVAVAK